VKSKWFSEFQTLIWAASLGIGAMIYLISTFASQSALAEKEVEIKSYVDQKHNSVEKRLDGIETVLDRIDQRIYEMQRRK
jgi:Tfp pilus assembly protein PilO